MRGWLIALLIAGSTLSAWASGGDDGVHLVGSKGPSTGNVSLGWNGGLSPYSVFRSTTPVDVTTQLSYLGTSTAEAWIDTPPVGGVFYYYIQGQCDFHPPELCNGLDDDCDPATPDGSQDPQVGAACDGADGDSCLEGTNSCFASSLACSDATGTTAELCNGDGLDEDCDGAVDEGF